MKNLIIAATLVKKLPINRQSDYIGVDKGALFLAKNQIKMEVAIGDFDSIKPRSLNLIKSFSKEVILLNQEKNETDLEAALNLAYNRGYKEVEIYGAIGARQDHFLANLILLDRFKNKLFIRLLDDKNEIFLISEHKQHLINKDGYKYCSFFTFNEAFISLNGFKYGLENYLLKKDDIRCISNQISDEVGSLILTSGEVIVIKSKD